MFSILCSRISTPHSPPPTLHKKEVPYWFCFPSPLQWKVMCSPISLLLQLLHLNLNRPDSRPDSLWKFIFSYYDRLKWNFSRIKINTSSQIVTYFLSFWMNPPAFWLKILQPPWEIFPPFSDFTDSKKKAFLNAFPCFTASLFYTVFTAFKLFYVVVTLALI